MTDRNEADTDAQGGAIFNGFGSPAFPSSMTIHNSSIVNNRAIGDSARGGGISNALGVAILTIDNNSIVNNRAIGDSALGGESSPRSAAPRHLPGRTSTQIEQRVTSMVSGAECTVTSVAQPLSTHRQAFAATRRQRATTTYLETLRSLTIYWRPSKQYH